MKRDQVIQLLAGCDSELHENYAVKSSALFDSATRDEARRDSDVDFLVEFSRPVGLFHFIGLQQYLESILGCPVDLGTLGSLNPTLTERILQEAIYVA
jgi:uncharacterized protein